MIPNTDYPLLVSSSYLMGPTTDSILMWDALDESERRIPVRDMQILDFFTERAALVLALRIVRAAGIGWLLLKGPRRREPVEYVIAREFFYWEEKS